MDRFDRMAAEQRSPAPDLEPEQPSAPTPHERLCAAVRHEVHDLGRSVHGLAQVAGVPSSSVKRLLAGGGCNFENGVKLAHALELRLDPPVS